jgi:hypothetical protein
MTEEKKQPPSITIRRAGDYERTRYHRMCVTGLSGSGKTVLGTTVPDGITLVAEPVALPTIRAWNPNQAIIEIKSHTQLSDALTWARNSNEARKYATLVVDSGTECGDIIKKWVIHNSPSRAKMEKAGLKNTMSLDDWGTYYSELDRLMRSFTMLPMHTLVLAQAFELIDETTRSRYLRPNFEGNKFPPRFPGYFSLSGVLERVPVVKGSGVERRVVFEAPSDLYLVKTAKGLGDIEVPDVSTWIRKMDEATVDATEKGAA